MKPLLFPLLFVIISLSACRKLLPEPDSDVSAVQEANGALIAFDDIFKQVDALAEEYKLMKNGPTITFDTSATNKLMTIDFGDSTMGSDGRIRKGVVEVRWTGKFRDIGKTVIITPIVYYVNYHQVEGTMSVTRMGNGLSGSPEFMVKVDDGRITFSDGKRITFDCNNYRKWIQGHQTPAQILDDVYMVSWSAHGHTSNGKSYELNSKRDLRIEQACPFRITEGILQIWPEDKDPRNVDFGNGNCDSEITVEINEKVYIVRR